MTGYGGRTVDDKMGEHDDRDESNHWPTQTYHMLN